MNDESRVETHNSILNALPADDMARLKPLLERVDLPLGKVLYLPEQTINHVYFPGNAMISVIAHTLDGHATEVAVIGGEGAAGLSVLLGADSTPYENMVQLADGGMRMKTADVRKEFDRGGAMHDLLLQFANRLMTQISQTALCNRVHSMEKRLSKWLLMCRDRTGSETLGLTQEFLGMMLGANRTTVTTTAQGLQDAGFISYKRGKIKIDDAAGLEGFTCDCYGVVRTAYDKK